jgi:hypothetical protein
MRFYYLLQFSCFSFCCFLSDCRKLFLAAFFVALCYQRSLGFLRFAIWSAPVCFFGRLLLYLLSRYIVCIYIFSSFSFVDRLLRQLLLVFYGSFYFKVEIFIKVTDEYVLCTCHLRLFDILKGRPCLT